MTNQVNKDSDSPTTDQAEQIKFVGTIDVAQLLDGLTADDVALLHAMQEETLAIERELASADLHRCG